MKRPGLFGFLLLIVAVTILVKVPMESAWKWPTVMVLLILGFIMLFISGAQRPSRPMSGSKDRDADGVHLGWSDGSGAQKSSRGAGPHMADDAGGDSGGD